MSDILFIIITATAIAIVLNVYFKKHDIPPIIGYIIAGFSISLLFDLSANHESLLVIGEFGIVFLMFTIALEFSIAHLRAMKREVLLFGGMQVLLTLSIIALVAHYFFDLNAKSAIILGSALALSSTAIVLKILNESGEIAKPYGRKSLGILLFQDLAIIPIFLMITIFSDQGKSLGELLLYTFVDAIIALSILYVIGRYVLTHFLTWVTNTNSSEIFIASILFIVVASSMIAHAFGFSYSLGAFIAGIMIAETRFKFQVESDLIPFRDILLGVFFVTVGMQINFHFLLSNILTVMVILAAIMLLKALIIFSFLSFFTVRSTALRTAITLSQIGEFSFAVFELARVNHIFEEHLSQTMLIAVVFSMILTPFMIRNINFFTDWLKQNTSLVSEEIRHHHDFADHVIICGYSAIGKRVASKLRKAGIRYIAIDNHHQRVQKGQEEGDSVIYGNAAQKPILYKAGLKTAAAVIVAIDDEHKARVISEAVSTYAANMNIIVRVPDRESFALLEGIPLEHVIDENDLISQEMVNKALSCSVRK